MVRKISFLLSVLMLMSSLLLLSGCVDIGSEEGMNFMLVSDASLYTFAKYYDGPEDAYLCIVDDYAGEELVIPSTYKGKPVVAVSSGTDSQSQASVKSLVLPEGVMYVDSGFGGYSNLASISFPESLVGVFSSFNGCKALTSIKFMTHSSMTIRFSFNRCTNLENVVYSYGVNDVSDDSFVDDPRLPGSVSYEPSGETTTVPTEPVNESEYSEYMEEICAAGNDWANGVMMRAIDKLCDAGTVTRSTISDEHLFKFSGFDGVLFADDEVRAQLTSGFVLDGPVICARYRTYSDSQSFSVLVRPLEADPSLSDFDYIDIRNGSFADSFARSVDECRYLIVMMGVISNVEEGFYMGNIDRCTTSTEVLIIDTSSEEVVHIEHIGANRPADTTQFATGKMLEDEATEYVRSLMG